MKGRKPKPTNLRLLGGNAGHRAINKDEPRPQPHLPDPPGFLDKEAVAEWWRMAPKLYKQGLLSEIDDAALAAYCQSYSRWAQAERAIQNSGMIIKTSNGNFIQSPMVGIANKAAVIMGKFLVEFGMTPSSRTRVSGKAPDGQDPWEYDDR